MWELLFQYARKKTLTDISGANLLLLEPSCFRNIVLSYFEKASSPSEITCLVLCSIQYKKTEIKGKGGQSIFRGVAKKFLEAGSKSSKVSAPWLSDEGDFGMQNS